MEQQPQKETTHTSTTTTVSKKSNKTLWIVITVVVLLLCCGCIAALLAGGWIAKQSGESVINELEKLTPYPTGISEDTGEVISGDLPIAPEGYAWQSCPSMDSYFLKPDGWFFLEEELEESTSCYISKEDISTNYLFDTGLTVFMYDNVTTEIGTSASEYAQGIAQTLQENNNGSEITTINENNGLVGYGIYINSNFDGKLVSQYTVAMANDAGDRVYLITFESPTSEWKQTWESIGGTIIDNLLLYTV